MSAVPNESHEAHLHLQGLAQDGDLLAHIMAVNHRCYEVSISSELMHSARKPNSKKTKHRQATGRRQMQPESESEPESEIDDTLDDWQSSEDEI